MLCQRIIWLTGDGEHFIPGPQISGECDGECVCSAGNERPDERSLRVEDFCVDLLQGIPAQIVIPVACRSSEAGLADPAGLHSVNDLQLIEFGRFVDLVKTVLQTGADFVAERKHIPGDAAGCIECIQFFSYQFFSVLTFLT